jgi:hypothetical protein
VSKKTAILILVAVILGGISLFLYFDSLPPKKIQIAYRIVPAGKTSAVEFLLDPAYPMMRIKVTPANEPMHALWELTPVNKPVTKDAFVYGEEIPGMKPLIPGAKPEPLDPTSKYLMVVSFAKNVRGECTFEPKPVTGRR